jgi:spoIIIJ-associated protein
MQTAVATGKTLEEAQAAALAELGAPADDVQFETLEEPRKVLGFSSGEYKVQAALKTAAETTEAGAEDEAPAEAEAPLGAPPVQPITGLEGETGDATQQVIALRAVEFLTETTRLMGLKTDVVVVAQEPGEVTVEIRGEGLGTLIGRQGATLDVVDAEKYREHRREMLVELAQQQADKAKESQQEVVIPDLKPFERRIVHLALVDDPEVETYSEGEGDDRCIVISPRNA